MTTQKDPHKSPQKRSPAKFDGRAKIVSGAAAMVALLGGWNAIGHLENGTLAAAAPAAAAALPAALPAAQPVAVQQVQTGATLESLGIAPVAALPALPQVLAQGSSAGVGAGSQANSALQIPTLPTLQAVPALPTLQALPEIPAMPAQPPPPPAASSSTRSGGS